MYVCMYVCMHRTEMDLFKPYRDFSETRQWKCFVYLKVSFINFNEAILSHGAMCVILASKMSTSVKYMDVLTKSGINNAYNQRSVVGDSKTPFCRNTMWIVVFPSPARINATQRHNTYKPLSITYSNFIPFKHRLINPFLCCTIKFLV
jgi:hypothetical protein